MARWLLAAAMVAVGVLHFVAPADFVRIVPPYLPAPLALVLVSGACEIALGVALLVPRLRALARWGLVALYIAVFPANLYMAFRPDEVDPDRDIPRAALWARLPLQAVFIAWALWAGRDETR